MIVSSGGSIEPVPVAALPDASHGEWGAAPHHLEGAVVTADDDLRFVDVRMTRRA